MFNNGEVPSGSGKERGYGRLTSIQSTSFFALLKEFFVVMEDLLFEYSS